MVKKKTSKLTLAPSRAASVVKLDLGAGQSPREGFEGVDLNAKNTAHKVDLFKFPWPFKDNSVDELHSSHFIEHIPNRDIEECDIIPQSSAGARDRLYEEFVGKDMFFAFFDECYRILKPNGLLTLIWPALRSNRAFQDPTHRRFIPMETMFYMTAEWRRINKLDHYRVNCDFEGNINFTLSSEESVFTQEVQAKRFSQYWNTIIDFHATMKAVKPSR